MAIDLTLLLSMPRQAISIGNTISRAGWGGLGERMGLAGSSGARKALASTGSYAAAQSVPAARANPIGKRRQLNGRPGPSGAARHD